MNLCWVSTAGLAREVMFCSQGSSEVSFVIILGYKEGNRGPGRLPEAALFLRRSSEPHRQEQSAGCQVGVSLLIQVTRDCKGGTLPTV